MVNIQDRIQINVPAEKIYQWLINLDRNYLSWHPDHVKCEWRKRTPSLVGAILYCEEILHGELHAMEIRITTVQPNKKIEFHYQFPMSLISPKGAFIIESHETFCIFIASTTFRGGWLLKKLAHRQYQALCLHMKEEGENLKKLLENPL